MTTLAWINNFIRGLVTKVLSKEDPVYTFILSHIDNSSFLTALHVHGLPHPYNLLSTWQPEDLLECQSDHVTFFCLNPPMAMSCHPQKAHSPYPDPQGSSYLNCQLILWFHLLSPPFLLTHSAPPKLVPAKGFFWNCSTLGYLHGLLHKFRVFSPPQIISYERTSCPPYWK